MYSTRACSLNAEEFSGADELQNPLHVIFYKLKVKVKQSYYKPGVTQRVPGS